MMVSLIIYVLAIILILPVTVFVVQVLAAVFFAKISITSTSNDSRASLVVLMPAHNESLVVAKTIESILPQLTSKDQLLVVADNCSDDTASIARGVGATVIVRSSETQRGKGFALDFGLQFLKKTPPNIVLIIDADCIVSENTIAKLASACEIHRRPIQALYIMQSQPNPSVKERIVEFAWIVKNKVRPLGFRVLGMPCQLMGTGMAFLWEDIIKIQLASGHIVEDMKLGTDLARLNKSPLFLPGALVTSVFPPTAMAANTQRTRWEHGHLSVIFNEAPSLFFEAIKTRNLQMFGLACDLIVPPLAVLIMLSASALLLSFIFSVEFAFLLTFILLAALVCAVLLAWASFGREVVSFKQLCFAPVYALMKMPLYIKFFFNRQVEWVRSKRD